MRLMMKAKSMLNIPSHSMTNDDDFDGGYENQYDDDEDTHEDEDYVDYNAADDEGSVASFMILLMLSHGMLCYAARAVCSALMAGCYAVLCYPMLAVCYARIYRCSIGTALTASNHHRKAEHPVIMAQHPVIMA